MFDTARVRLLGMSGSLRIGSYSNAVLETLRERFADRADLKVYALERIPLYNQDLEGERRPATVQDLLAAIAEADGLVLCAPEFNHSIPGVLKNALDWASRPAFSSVMAHKPVMIMTISAGSLGGAGCRAQLHAARFDAGAGYRYARRHDYRRRQQDPRLPARRRGLARFSLRRCRSPSRRDPDVAALRCREDRR